MIVLPVLARYVVGAVLRYTLLVMLVLMILTGLYLFITQQDEIGTGNYRSAMRSFSCAEPAAERV